jgi:anti-anti-sigma factor
MAEAESIDPRARGTRLQVVPVHWNGQGRVALMGEIDLANAHEVEAALTDMASNGTPLTLDVVGLSYIDSQGVALLFRLAKRARLNGGSLTVANPLGLVRRVLEITHAGEAVTIIDEV